MLWIIIKVLFFIFIVLPIICYILSCVFEGIGNAFRAIIDFPDKVIKAYQKNKIKGLISLFVVPLGILDWCLFCFGIIGILAFLGIFIDSTVPVYLGVASGIVGCLLVTLSAHFYVKYLYPEFTK